MNCGLSSWRQFFMTKTPSMKIFSSRHSSGTQNQYQLTAFVIMEKFVCLCTCVSVCDDDLVHGLMKVLVLSFCKSRANAPQEWTMYILCELFTTMAPVDVIEAEGNEANKVNSTQVDEQPEATACIIITFRYRLLKLTLFHHQLSWKSRTIE